MTGSTFLFLAAALLLVPRRLPGRIGYRRVQVGSVSHLSLPPSGRNRTGRRPAPAPALAGLATVAAGYALAGAPGLVVAALSAPFVVLLIRRRVAAHTPVDRAGQAAVPLLLDLVAAALRAGVPTAGAVRLVAGTAPDALALPLRRASALLQLGAAPTEAWGTLAGDALLGSAALLAIRSADSGVRLADSFEAHAEELRARLRSAGIQRAHHVATLALLPLGLCFLPAFVCIGIVPIVAGIAGGIFGGAPP